MPGEQRADRVAGHLGDLFEAQLPVVAEFDDLSVCVSELLHRVSERIDLFLTLVIALRIRFCSSFDPREVFWRHRPGMSRSLSAIISYPIHRDPEQPRLEFVLLGIARGVELGRDRDKHGLGYFLGELFVMQSAPSHRKHPPAVEGNELFPSGFIAGGC